MVIPSAGLVVIVSFPFSDLTSSKLRPAVVVASASKNDWILAQITSKTYDDEFSVEIKQPDFSTGGLRLTSFVRTGKLFTANQILFQGSAGLLNLEKFSEIITSITKIINSSLLK